MKIKMNNILYFFFYSEKVNIVLLRNALKFLDHIKANSSCASLLLFIFIYYYSILFVDLSFQLHTSIFL